MSDQDNLRDRIEEIIWKRTTLPTEITTLVAQAIIDEFGLTVEHSMVGHEVHEDGSWTTWPSQSRVIGEWEESE